MLPGEERTLLLLGLLMAQSQHGYQINEFIERNLSTVIDMKKPTAYAIAAAGYVSVQTEQEGRRPPRNVYAITEAGTRRFFELLREGLSTAGSGRLMGDVPLMSLDHLPPKDVAECLGRRLQDVRARLQDRRRLPPEHGRNLQRPCDATDPANSAPRHHHETLHAAWRPTLVREKAIDPTPGRRRRAVGRLPARDVSDRSILSDMSATRRAVMALAFERPDWVPVLRAACLHDPESERFGGECVGSWVLQKLTPLTGEPAWKPGLRLPVSYGLMEKSGKSTRGGRRSHYRMPNRAAVEQALAELQTGPSAAGA